ncbi:hypothetical protein [Thermanaerothrix sp.]|uniref:hypothetical protein n=1 Tax=Thermanaerothrix sp. TaxID=2972675 RepID=UPI002ADD70B4|nr:hypothetical protein [Thermanaerothrix sp.]
MSAVPLRLGGFANEKPLVKAHRGKSQPHSLRVRWLSTIPFALITVATPAQATALILEGFALQLRGPFGSAVRAGSHLTLLSGAPWRCLLVLFSVFRVFG